MLVKGSPGTGLEPGLRENEYLKLLMGYFWVR